jgi:hypothetical protein
MSVLFKSLIEVRLVLFQVPFSGSGGVFFSEVYADMDAVVPS